MQPEHLIVSNTVLQSFGLFEGQRVMSPLGPATIIGVDDGKLYVQVDRKQGLFGFSKMELRPLEIARAYANNTDTWSISEILDEAPEQNVVADDKGFIYYLSKGKLWKKDTNPKSDGSPQALCGTSSDLSGVYGMLWYDNYVFVYLDRKSKMLKYSTTRECTSFATPKKMRSYSRITMDESGNFVYIQNNSIHIFNPFAKTVKTILDNINDPSGVALGKDGTIYFCECDLIGVRQIKDGAVSTLVELPPDQGRTVNLLKDNSENLFLHRNVNRGSTLLRVYIKTKTVTVVDFCGMTYQGCATLAPTGALFLAKYHQDIRKMTLHKMVHNWNLVRLLWIGHLKGDASNCHFVRLPKEIIREVALFVHSWGERNPKLTDSWTLA